MEEKNVKRRFPLKEEFLGDKTMNDIIYGYLLANSHLTKDTHKRYCWKNDVTAGKIIKYFNEELGIESPVKERALRDVLKAFVKIDLLKEDKLDNKAIYTIPDVEWVDGKPEYLYVEIKTETLKFLVDAANSNVIKVYAFLKLKQQQHDRYHKNGDSFRFAKEDLLDVIGYKAKNYGRSMEMITHILDSLQNNGLIKFHKEPVELTSGHSTEYHVLDEVNDDYKKSEKSIFPDNSVTRVPVKEPKGPVYNIEPTRVMDYNEFRF